MTTTTLNLTKVGISFVETFQRAFHSSILFILIQPYILHNVLLQYHQGHKKYVIQNDTFVRPKSQLCRRFAANFQFSSKCSSLKGIKFANGKYCEVCIKKCSTSLYIYNWKFQSVQPAIIRITKNNNNKKITIIIIILINLWNGDIKQLCSFIAGCRQLQSFILPLLHSIKHLSCTDAITTDIIWLLAVWLSGEATLRMAQLVLWRETILVCKQPIRSTQPVSEVLKCSGEILSPKPLQAFQPTTAS